MPTKPHSDIGGGLKMKFYACSWKPKTVSYSEAEIFVFMMDGAILGLLSSDEERERDALLEYF